MSCLGKKKLHLKKGKKSKAGFAKTLIHYMNRVHWDVFPYDSNVGNDECLSDTLEDTDSDVKIL